MRLRISLLGIVVFIIMGCDGRSTPAAKEAPLPATATTTPSNSVETATAIPTAEPDPTLTASVESVASLGQLSEASDAFLHAYLQDLIYQQGEPPPRHVPGAVLLVESPAGRSVKAAGVSSLDSGRPLEVDDRFEIGSITKLFTAATLLRLHEEDVLSLDDPLAMWLPEVAAQFPYGAEMTLRQLAAHTAGLGEYEHDLYPMPRILSDQSTLEQGYTPAELTTWVADNKQPLFSPGAPGQWMYSNTGYILLGMALEAATGQSLDEIYDETIFGPLGMESAILLNAIPEADEIVHGYNAMTGDYVDVSRWNASGAWAAGALAMNAADLARFGSALIGDELFADEATLDEMTRFISTGQQRGFTDYGLGLSRLTAGVWGHGGGTPGFGTLLLLLPDAGVTAVYLGNNGAFNINPNEFSDVVTRAISLSP